MYELQKLRCNLCGEVFTAQTPPGVGPDKYDAESASMIALLKYGSGLPFNRLERLEGSLGIPLPATTQWEIVEHSAGGIEPVFEQMIRQAAQGQVLHHDDTKMKVLALSGPPGEPAGSDPTESLTARACSPPGSSRSSMGTGSRCSSQGTAMRGRTWPPY